MEKQAITKSQPQFLANQTQSKKPVNYLAAAINCQKIRDYGPIEKKQTAEIYINILLSILGVNSNGQDLKELHYLAVLDFIQTKLNRYSFEELKEAFYLYVSGAFQHEIPDKIYNKLDCVVLGRVMNAYQNYKAEITRSFPVENKDLLLLQQKTELTESEKKENQNKAIKEAFDYYFNNKNLGVGRVYIFDILNKRKLLSFSSEYTQDVLKRAKERDEKKIKSSGKGNIAIRKALSEYEKKSASSKVNLTARYITIEDFFENIIKKEININDLLAS